MHIISSLVYLFLVLFIKGNKNIDIIPIKVIVIVCKVCTINANERDSDSEIPKRTNEDITNKCHAPMPPCTGTTEEIVLNVNIIIPILQPML